MSAVTVDHLITPHGGTLVDRTGDRPEGVDVLAPRYFNGRKMTIYGGSSEVQRGIMSKVMLGL